MWRAHEAERLSGHSFCGVPLLVKIDGWLRSQRIGSMVDLRLGLLKVNSNFYNPFKTYPGGKAS